METGEGIFKELHGKTVGHLGLRQSIESPQRESLKPNDKILSTGGDLVPYRIGYR